MKDVSLQYLGKSLLAAFATYASLNVLAFLMLFGNSLVPLPLPYSENFDHLSRLDYRQFGGLWKVQGGALLQTVENGSDLMAVIPLQLRADQPYRFQAHLAFRSGQSGGGLMFNLQHSDMRNESQMVRFGSDQGQTYFVYGYFDAQSNFVEQGRGPYDLSGAPEGVSIAVEVGTVTYDILVDGQIIADDIPLLYQGGSAALTTWFSQVAFDDVSISELPSPETAPAETAPDTTTESVDRAPPPEVQAATFNTSFASGDDISQWQPFSGNWAFEQGALVQTNTGGFDNGIAYLGWFSRFVLSVQFTHRDGIGGGVLFNMPHPDTQSGAHMVRFFPDDSLVWGYFDQSNVFHGQSNVLVDAVETGSHTLQIVANGTTYDITLDGQLLASNIPLMSAQGYIGLTASQSVVAFEQVSVQNLDAPVVSEGAETAGSVGDWVHSANMLTQNRADGQQYFTPVEVYGESFNVSVDITLPELSAEQTGGGLIFHAANSVNPAGGSIVRLLGSQQVVWGTLDPQSQFQPQGSADVALANGTHTLSLHVRSADYDIFLDDAMIATSVPMQAEGGWLYFDALSGPITFANFTMNLTESRD